MDDWIEIDYRGEDVTVENLRRVLTGRSSSSSSTTTTSAATSYASTTLPVLQSNAQSNVLIYLTGHGGDTFFKFQDVEEIMATEIAHLIAQMHKANMYQNLLLIADTCQAFTLADSIHNSTSTPTPNVTIVASSLRGESSYAHHSDADLGLAVIERYTHAMSQFVENKDLSTLTIEQGMLEPYQFAQQQAHIGYKTTTMTTTRQSNESNTTPLLFMSDFFANVEASSHKKATRTSGGGKKTHDYHSFTPRLLYPLQQQGHDEATSSKTNEKDDTENVLAIATTASTNNNNNLLFFGSSQQQQPVSLFSLEEMPFLSSLQVNYDTVSNQKKDDDNDNDWKHDNHRKNNQDDVSPLLLLSSTPPPIVVVLGLTTLLLGGLVFLGRIMERYLLL